MIATGLLLTVASLAFSYARPVQELSPVRAGNSPSWTSISANCSCRARRPVQELSPVRAPAVGCSHGVT